MGSTKRAAFFIIAASLIFIIIVYEIWVAPFSRKIREHCEWLNYCDQTNVNEIYVIQSGNWLMPESLTKVDGDDRKLLSVPLVSFLLNTSVGYVLIGAGAEPSSVLPDNPSFPITFLPAENESLPSILAFLNVSTLDISHVLLWSLESDNTGYLKYFTNATFWCNEGEWNFATGPNVTSRYRPDEFYPYFTQFQFFSSTAQERVAWPLLRGLQLIMTPGTSPGHLSFGISLAEERDVFIAGGLSFSLAAVDDKVLRPDVFNQAEAKKSIAIAKKYYDKSNINFLLPHDPDVVASVPRLPEYYS